jgi:acetyltransferase
LTLKDGTNLVLRPIRPDDEPMLVKFHETLSERAVYFRYFHSVSLKSRVAHERLARICFVDYEREIVLVADYKEPKTGQHSILGVGRLNKLQYRKEGEVAVLVSDHYQHRGLGTELLRQLTYIARDQKLTRVTGEMLRENLAMQTLAKKLGFSLRLLEDPNSIKASLDFAPKESSSLRSKHLSEPKL